MEVGIILLVTGIFLGYLLRNHSRILRIGSKLTDGAIFLLLFFLGVTVGMNEKIISNFQNIGLQSLVITLFATIGSMAVTFVFYKFFFDKQ
ncbi:MAG: lysine exporter LysO family protein [Bacteroidales bacterium]|nr:lysine exporter LysO family protein [Bacteroidales bacterium]